MLNNTSADIHIHISLFEWFVSVALLLCIMAVFLCISYWHTYSQPPASPSTQEAIQGMLSMANLSSSDSLQQPWSNTQSKNNSQSKSNSHSTQVGKKASGGGGGGGGSNNSKRPTKRLPKKPRKSSSVESLDYDDDQDHMDACFKDSDYGKHQLIPLLPFRTCQMTGAHRGQASVTGLFFEQMNEKIIICHA